MLSLSQASTAQLRSVAGRRWRHTGAGPEKAHLMVPSPAPRRVPGPKGWIWDWGCPQYEESQAGLMFANVEVVPRVCRAAHG